MKKGIHLRLDDEDLKKLKNLAMKKGVSVQTLIRTEVKSLLYGFVNDGDYWNPKPNSE